MRSSEVCDASKALPMSGKATFATARFRFATAATRMSAINTRLARAGASESAEAARFAEAVNVFLAIGPAIECAVREMARNGRTNRRPSLNDGRRRASPAPDERRFERDVGARRASGW